MSFRFSAVETSALPVEARCVEDRRNNPVRNRSTQFRLLQQNILAYTYPFVPGFTGAGINALGFGDLIAQSLLNADSEGRLLYGADYHVEGNARAKVTGDIFEKVEAAIHWNLAARWNTLMSSGEWPMSPRYPRPSTPATAERQVAVLSLPRRFDWVRLLEPNAASDVAELRAELASHGLTMPTSTPDLLVVQLPAGLRNDSRFSTELADLSRSSQEVLDSAYRSFEGALAASDFLLAIALKVSLRSDRLYQPLYEANVMQLILEGRLGAPQVDFEVHTLQSAGTRAEETYRAASLGLVANGSVAPHRAVRELYEPPTAEAVVRRFLSFLDHRIGVSPAVRGGS